jgi:hypothetical protein
VVDQVQVHCQRYRTAIVDPGAVDPNSMRPHASMHCPSPWVGAAHNGTTCQSSIQERENDVRMMRWCGVGPPYPYPPTPTLPSPPPLVLDQPWLNYITCLMRVKWTQVQWNQDSGGGRIRRCTQPERINIGPKKTPRESECKRGPGAVDPGAAKLRTLKPKPRI